MICRSSLNLVAGACLALSACGALQAPDTDTLAPTRSPTHASAVRLSQVGFGTAARFARCAEPACPIRTTKVLANAAEPARVRPGTATETVDAPHVMTDQGSPDLWPATLSPAPAPTLAPARDGTLTLRFGTNASHLTPAHKAELSAAVDRFRQSDVIVIFGRTDDAGSESVNRALALARGMAVRDYLLDLEPDLPARISIDARGRCCYVASNGTPAARALNRRVEIVARRVDQESP